MTWSPQPSGMSSPWIRVPVISTLKLGNTHNGELRFFLYHTTPTYRFFLVIFSLSQPQAAVGLANPFAQKNWSSTKSVIKRACGAPRERPAYGKASLDLNVYGSCDQDRLERIVAYIHTVCLTREKRTTQTRQDRFLETTMICSSRYYPRSVYENFNMAGVCCYIDTILMASALP